MTETPPVSSSESGDGSGHAPGGQLQPGINVQQPGKAAYQQARRNQQNQRQRYLSYDEQTAKLHAAVTAGGTAAFIAQRLVHVCL